MMRAVRAVSSERGRDPREYALFAFGGNGPLFAAGMAAALEMDRIVVPPAPGLFSSFGLLYSDVEHHYVRSHRRLLRAADAAGVEGRWAAREEDARAQLGQEGFAPSAQSIRRAADLRYQGQSFELSVPVAGPLAGTESLQAVAQAFGHEHERTYGHRAGPEEPVEIVSLRVVAQGIPDRPRVPDRLEFARARRSEQVAIDIAGRATQLPAGGAPAAGQERTRPVYFGPGPGWLETPIIDRGALVGGRHGPCIVEEYDATCLVPPDARAALDAWGNIVIDLGADAHLGRHA